MITTQADSQRDSQLTAGPRDATLGLEERTDLEDAYNLMWSCATRCVTGGCDHDTDDQCVASWLAAADLTAVPAPGADVTHTVEWGVLDVDGSCDVHPALDAAATDHARWPGGSLVRITTITETLVPGLPEDTE